MPIDGYAERRDSMSTSDAQKRASAKYRKRNVKTVAINFYPSEADLYSYLTAQKNRSGYIKDLIKQDMEKPRR